MTSGPQLGTLEGSGDLVAGGALARGPVLSPAADVWLEATPQLAISRTPSGDISRAPSLGCLGFQGTGPNSAGRGAPIMVKIGSQGSRKTCPLDSGVHTAREVLPGSRGGLRPLISTQWGEC